MYISLKLICSVLSSYSIKITLRYLLKIWGSWLLSRHRQLSVVVGITPTITSLSDNTLVLPSNLVEDKLEIEMLEEQWM